MERNLRKLSELQGTRQMTSVFPFLVAPRVFRRFKANRNIKFENRICLRFRRIPDRDDIDSGMEGKILSTYCVYL